MCFELLALRWENSLFLLKVVSSPRHRSKSAESAGESLSFTSAERGASFLRYICISF